MADGDRRLRQGSEHAQKSKQGDDRGILASIFARRWGGYAAITGITTLLLIAVAITSVRYFHNSAQQRADAAAARGNYFAHQQECAGFTLPVAWLECLIDKANASHDQRHAQQDLRAQQDMAGATLVLMATGIIGLLASVVGIIFVYENLREMRNQTLATREIGENQSKAYAWVSEISVRFPKPLGDGQGLIDRILGSSITATLTIRNEGQTPAIEVSAWAVIEMTLADKIYLNKIQLEQQTKKEPRARVIAPNQPTKLTLHIDDTRETAERTPAGVISPNDWGPIHGPPLFEISGTLQYRDVFSRKWYHSTFKFRGHAIDDGEARSCYRLEDGEELFREVKNPRTLPTEH